MANNNQPLTEKPNNPIQDGQVLPSAQELSVDQQSHSGALLSMWQGPLPPPAVLEEYDRIRPGAAERILVMAEKEQQHRHDTENESIGAQVFYTRSMAVADVLARFFGQAFLALTFLVSLYFACKGEAKLAAIFFSPFIVVALVKLISGEKKKKN